jgi:hypothetical protein
MQKGTLTPAVSLVVATSSKLHVPPDPETGNCFGVASVLTETVGCFGRRTAGHGVVESIGQTRSAKPTFMCAALWRRLPPNAARKRIPGLNNKTTPQSTGTDAGNNLTSKQSRSQTEDCLYPHAQVMVAVGCVCTQPGASLAPNPLAGLPQSAVL